MARKSTDNAKESQWISLSDLMAALMMVFLFIAIAMMRNSLIERDEAKAQSEMVKEVIDAYQDNQVAIYEALMKEFGGNLENWEAEIYKKDLTITIQSPKLLFANDEIALKPEFKQMLDDFFPRYLTVLTQGSTTTSDGATKYFRDSISEVRIEGHTNSTGKGSEKENYIYNMNLSQGRTRSVLDYVYELPKVQQDIPWMKKHLAAVGLSSSRLIFKEKSCNSDVVMPSMKCTEDREKSRRVTFRIITNSDAEMQKIISKFNHEN
jgi:outer membrane protein OmpA-like peptidoglycan-associated protein